MEYFLEFRRVGEYFVEVLELDHQFFYSFRKSPSNFSEQIDCVSCLIRDLHPVERSQDVPSRKEQLLGLLVLHKLGTQAMIVYTLTTGSIEVLREEVADFCEKAEVEFLGFIF